MTLPVNIVLVRHGESEGNAAKRAAEKGDLKAFERVHKDRHTSSLRLTEKGRHQADQAGEWIREHLLGKWDYGFDRFMVSEYHRAMETAARLELPGARWYTDADLSERDWGELDKHNGEERELLFRDNIRMKDINPYFWRPPNGESFHQLRLRLYRVLQTLHRECEAMNVTIVGHGEVMWGLRVLLERMSQERFKELHLSPDRRHKIHNCQIIHYTRRNPETGQLSRHIDWVRMIRPTANPVEIFDWEPIVRPVYTNEELMAMVERNSTLAAA